METRLNRRLNGIMNRMIEKLIRNPEIYTAREIETPIRASYSSVIPHTIHAATLDVSKVPGIEISSAIKGPSSWGTYIDDRVFKASDRTINRMTGDVMQKMREHVTDGKSQQKTTRELRRELRNMKQYELERITRTETHSIYMEAKQDIFNQVDSIVGKQWQTNGPGEHRPWHVDMDGETVAYNDTFSNNLLYPGDMDGDAEEVINCGCNMKPITDPLEIK